MKKERLIFVTNDDGYAAKGFAAAIEVAREFGRVVAVAPRETQSGRSQAITMYEPLFLEQRVKEDGLDVYSLSGTPVDCVKWTFDHLLGDGEVDLVISGIVRKEQAWKKQSLKWLLSARALWVPPSRVVSMVVPR